ncbi:MAG: cytidylyltransferase domain-containing protein [Promethearchaeota archaeon]
MKILAIIPARCGSKGIKHKNIVKISGKPLIQYTIEPALKSLKNGLVERLIVSTDCEEIKQVVQGLGVEVPFLRPKEISGDKAKAIDYIIHALDFFGEKNIFFDAVLVLQPTAPLREYDDIEKSINLFKNFPNSDSLISCYKEEYFNSLVTYKKNNNLAIPVNPDHNKGIRRQEHETIFIRNGAIYIAKVKYLRKSLRIIADIPLMYEMPKSKSVNIDTEEDLKILRKLLLFLVF